MNLMQQLDDFLLPMGYTKPRVNHYYPPKHSRMPWVSLYRSEYSKNDNSSFTEGEIETDDHWQQTLVYKFDTFQEFLPLFRKILPPTYGTPTEIIKTLDDL